MNTRVKPIKKALAKKYGFKNVSVKNGEGTAWGWVRAKIETNKPSDCSCSPNETYCQSCRNKINETSREAEGIAFEALRKENLKFYTYSSDDGYGTETSEFILQVNLV